MLILMVIFITDLISVLKFFHLLYSNLYLSDFNFRKKEWIILICWLFCFKRRQAEGKGRKKGNKKVLDCAYLIECKSKQEDCMFYWTEFKSDKSKVEQKYILLLLHLILSQKNEYIIINYNDYL